MTEAEQQRALYLGIPVEVQEEDYMTAAQKQRADYLRDGLEEPTTHYINNRRYTKKRRNKNGRVEAYDATLDMWQLQDNIPYAYIAYINSLGFDEESITTPSLGRDYAFDNLGDGRESSYNSSSSDYSSSSYDSSSSSSSYGSSSSYDSSSSYSSSSDSSSSSSSSFD